MAVRAGRLRALLERRRGNKPRKTVRWPDQVADDDEDTGFRVGRPRQLEIVHLLPDLGPSSPCGVLRKPPQSFAAAVRAEHSAEQRLLLQSRSRTPL